MIGLLRLWLPVLPFAMAVLVLLSGLPDLGACPDRGGLLSLTIGCLEWPSTAVAIGPVDVLTGAVIPGGDLLVGVFGIVAVAVAAVGVRRIRALAR
jgi:hypothetical protein